MKKIIFAFILFPTVLLSQQVKRDSVFLDGKLVGLVHNEGTTLAAGVTYNNFTVYIDEFVSNKAWK